VDDAAALYFTLGATLELDWLMNQIGALPTADRWLAGARDGLRDELLAHHRSLGVAVMAGGMRETSTASRLEAWRHQHHGAITAWQALVADLRQQDEPDLARLSVALRAVGKLVAATRTQRED
jgi:glutamate dehydrogenase